MKANPVQRQRIDLIGARIPNLGSACLLLPHFLGMLYDIPRFNKVAPHLLESTSSQDLTLDELIRVSQIRSDG